MCQACRRGTDAGDARRALLPTRRGTNTHRPHCVQLQAMLAKQRETWRRMMRRSPEEASSEGSTEGRSLKGADSRGGQHAGDEGGIAS